MAIDANKWLHVPEGVPCIYDVDTRSVDDMGHWVRVKRRVLTPRREFAELTAAFSLHPNGRLAAGRTATAVPVSTCFIREVDMLPRWMQGRIAVLRMADPDTWVRHVGMRWGNEIKGGSPWQGGSVNSTGAWQRADDDGYRWYTLDVGCEGVK